MKLALYLLLTISLIAPGFTATCSGGANCRACRNCSKCKHCHVRKGTCSVCKPSLYRKKRKH